MVEPLLIPSAKVLLYLVERRKSTLFIKLKDGRKLNLIYLSDCFVGKHDTTKVIFYLVNGVKIVEEYDSAAEAEARVKETYDNMEASKGGGVIQRDTFDDFPAQGNKGFIYIDKSTGDAYYWDTVTETYISVGEAGQTGVYSTTETLPTTIGEEIEINKSDLTIILEPSSEYQQGSDVVDKNSVRGVIIGTNGNKVIVKTVTEPVAQSYKVLPTLADLPSDHSLSILYWIEDIKEFRLWDNAINDYIEPFRTIIVDDDTTVENAKPNTLYVNGNQIKYTTDNSKWTYIDSTAVEYETNTEYYKDKLLYLDNTLVKVLKDYKSPTGIDAKAAFYRDIQQGKLEVIVEGKIATTVTYDITEQLDGKKQTFNIDYSITKEKSMMVFYAGQLLLEGVNYTVDYDKHQITTLFPEAPDSDEDRHLTLFVGEIGSSSFVMVVDGDETVVDNTDMRRPKILHDSTKIDKSIANPTSGRIVARNTTKQDGENVVVETKEINVNTGSQWDSNTTIKSSDGTVKFKVTKQDQNTTVDVTSVGDTKVYQNYFEFDGTKKEFDLPDLDFDRPIMIIVNGVVLSSGIENDYFINKYNKKITFVLVWEEGSNNIILNL